MIRKTQKLATHNFWQRTQLHENDESRISVAAYAPYRGERGAWGAGGDPPPYAVLVCHRGHGEVRRGLRPHQSSPCTNEWECGR